MVLLLEHVDQLRLHLTRHEFSEAGQMASSLELICQGTNVMANDMADRG